jgi:hypothetical protein
MKPFIRPIVQFIRMPGGRGVLLEAVLWLGLARLALRLLPFRRLAPYLGIPCHETPATNPAQPAASSALTVTRALQRAARNLPWECTCLVQGLAGKAMLRRRGLPSTLYLGVAKDKDANLCAHAWLRCGSVILTGREAENRFTVISAFGDTRDER